jgi:hypothetical protein
MKKHLVTYRAFGLLLVFSLIAPLLAGCTFSLFNPSGLIPPTPTLPFPLSPTSTPQPGAEVTFNVTLPAPLQPGETLYLSVVDEVTGLALNAVDYPLRGVDTLHYTLAMPFPVNSVLKYRYLRQSIQPILEDNPFDQPVRYRMAYVAAPMTVQDVVASWSDRPFSGPVSTIRGQVVSAADGRPLPDILILAGGLRTLTDSSGNFSLFYLPPGTHNLVAYALDGMFQTFQQGATVVADKLTPVKLQMTPASLVNVVFTVILPRNTVPTAPIRIAGNLYQLGNTFGDLSGGLSTVATRMPVLSPLPDGRFTTTLALPAGADVRYKYTMGDGFWNAEHLQSGEFVLRQLIVPQGNALVEDHVETWQAGTSAPIIFDVTVPSETPTTDVISIQFNPYGWTEPIPMWPLGNNRWVYEVFSPLNMLGTFEYRYCRNDQCGVADDVATADGHHGLPISTSLAPQNIQDTVNAWTWLPTASKPELVAPVVTPRPAGFWAGVELQADYHPTWQALVPQAFQNIQALGANWAVITPTWRYSRVAPLVFTPQPGADPLWADTETTIARARALNLNAALFPSAIFPTTSSEWWGSAPLDTVFWNNWFARYEAFAVYYADLAAKTGAGCLILGGDWLTPALPGGSPSTPGDAQARWSGILAQVREHYPGALYWALPYPGGQQNPPAFIAETDGIYLLWNASLSNSATPTVEEMQAQAGSLLDKDIQPLQASLKKPLVLAVAYPSINGAASACPPDGAGGCLPWMAFDQPYADNPSFSVDLKAQVEIYQALLGALNSRPWITGFVSRGYYPPAILKDKSASIHGKPAADVLWYWYPRLLGVTH